MEYQWARDLGRAIGSLIVYYVPMLLACNMLFAIAAVPILFVASLVRRQPKRT